MNPQIKKVAYYIETHLDDELEVETLAKVAGYSPYHFCRVFRIYLGESAVSYATRLKLERAAREMIRAKKSMIEIALEAGYKTPTGFLKAFKQRFGTTPTNYKKDTLKQLNIYKEIKMNTPRIITREDTEVIFTRELGDYKKSSDIAWKRLSTKLHGLREEFTKRPPNSPMNIAIGKGEAIGICHDNPQVTDEANIRYDAALAWDKEDVRELKNYGFETKIIAGGKYAVVDYTGSANGEDAWYGLYAWVEGNGYKFRNEPAFEKYLNGATETDCTKFKNEVYIPIEE